ncbi:MAG: GspE/PulE family protein [Phycisphaerales bacterium]
MSKRDLDDILHELGVDADAPAEASKAELRGIEGGVKAGALTKAAPTARSRHTIDKAESAFSPLPPVPTGQRSFLKNVVVEDDPAVPVGPAPERRAAVGEALSEIYQGDDGKLLAGAGELEQLLVSRGIVTPAQVAQARKVLEQTPGKRLVELLVEQGCDEAQAQSALAELAGVPFERLDLAKDGGFDAELLGRLSLDYCKERWVIPIRRESARAVVGMLRPDDVFLVDDIRRRLGVSSVKVVVVTAFDLKGALEIAAQGNEQAVDVNELLAEVGENDVQVEKKASEEVDLEREAEQSPVIKFVNHIIQTAVREGASDIHIEPAEKKLKVRFRIDGELYEMMQPPASMSAAITSRLKIMANLDISERRLPQDGRIRCTVQNRKLDLRMSTLPNTYGEKTVMRILDTRSINVKLEDLGFEEDTLRIWRGLIEAPHGVVLVTGPTGSGKTTTLYSSLRTLDKNSMNISTVEDPVEYHLEGITQTQTHDKIGMSFAKALKALLRQDPDVILVGEIRDHETALTAIQASLTGHLVLSTLHTNDAPSSITRLVNIGLEPFLVAAAVNGVLAQRLVRRLCKECRVEKPATEEMRDFMETQGLNPEKLWSGKGCDKCRNTGFSGRLGIYELLAVDDSLRDIVVRNPNVAELRRLCTDRGMVSLRGDGLKKAARGLTSVEEILRATEATI